MKRLDRILTIGTFIVCVVLIGLGFYRYDKCPEEYVKNAIAMSAGLLSISASAGLCLGEMYRRSEQNYRRL